MVVVCLKSPVIHGACSELCRGGEVKRPSSGQHTDTDSKKILIHGTLLRRILTRTLISEPVISERYINVYIILAPFDKYRKWKYGTVFCNHQTAAPMRFEVVLFKYFKSAILRRCFTVSCIPISFSIKLKFSK